jgi:hypothetical protein
MDSGRREDTVAEVRKAGVVPEAMLDLPKYLALRFVPVTYSIT